MKKGLTEIVFILDRSGSMGGLENDTIGGYNSMIETLYLMSAPGVYDELMKAKKADPSEYEDYDPTKEW